MSPEAASTLPPQERAYYLATAMLTTAFEYGREGDAELWWSAFLITFTAWINAAYEAFVNDIHLNMSKSKLEMIEAAIVNFLPRLTPVDRRRWLGIKEAVARVRTANIAAGISGDIVRIGIESLGNIELETDDLVMDESASMVEPAEDVLSGDGEDDGSKATSSIRRSSRSSVKAEKMRAMEGDGEEEGSDDDGEEGSEGDDEDEEDGGGDEDRAPREKKKAEYLPFDASKHFHWAGACQYCSSGNWICFGDVYKANGKLSSAVKCQSCVILRKVCAGGIRKALDTIFVEPSVSKVPNTPQSRRQSKQTPVPAPTTIPKVPSTRSSFNIGETPSGPTSQPPFIKLIDPSLSRKRSALAPPTSAIPSSSKVLRPSKSSSGIRRTSSTISSSSSMPSPLAFSPSLPSPLSSIPASSSSMVVDPPEDQVLVLLDALEFAIDRGNLEDARKRIRALRKLRQREKGYPSV